MTTKGETISRVRTLVKGAKADAFLTDRFIYAMVLKYAKMFIARADNKNRLGRYTSLFQKYPGVQLVDSSPIEAGCINIDTCITFKKSENPLPPIFEASYGPLIRSVSSIDGSNDAIRTTPKLYSKITKSSTFKYNKNVYYWIQNNYIYFPNVEWPNVDIEAMWEDDIEEFFCDSCDCCVDRRSEKTNIPEDVFVEIENGVRQELLNMVQIPKDNKVDNQSLLR